MPLIARQLTMLALSLLFTVPAYAVTCSITNDNFNFGSADVLSSGNPLATVTSNATVSCQNGFLELPGNVTVCGEYGGGSGGAALPDRLMTKGADSLRYNLFTDANGTSILGASNLVQLLGPGLRVVFAGNEFNIFGGTVTRNITLFGRLNGNQPTAAVGNYVSQFSSPANANFTFRNGNQPCVAGQGTQGIINFRVTASVVPMCLLQTPADLNFGSRSSLDSVADATTAISLTCTRDASYSIALSNGINGQRNMKLNAGAALVRYELYKDAARSSVWGAGLIDSVVGTGTGGAQTFTVYGRVPSQTTPAVGAFTDTVTVTVTF